VYFDDVKRFCRKETDAHVSFTFLQRTEKSARVSVLSQNATEHAVLLYPRVCRGCFELTNKTDMMKIKLLGLLKTAIWWNFIKTPCKRTEYMRFSNPQPTNISVSTCRSLSWQAFPVTSPARILTSWSFCIKTYILEGSVSVLLLCCPPNSRSSFLFYSYIHVFHFLSYF